MLAAFVAIAAPISRKIPPPLACHDPPVSVPAAKLVGPCTVIVPPASDAIFPSPIGDRPPGTCSDCAA